jgi:hypothetical protein
MKLNFLFLFALILLTPLISANSFGYNYLDNTPTQVNNTFINNTYINQTLELNTTQFETGEPATINTSWLNLFIEAVSKWGNFVPYTGATGNVNLETHNLLAKDVSVGAVLEIKESQANVIPSNFNARIYSPNTDTGDFSRRGDLILQPRDGGAVDIWSSGVRQLRVSTVGDVDVRRHLRLRTSDNQWITQGVAENFKQYFDGTNQRFDLTSGNFVFNGGNVGIGTTSPQKKLHVVDGAGTLPTLGSQIGLFQNNALTTSNAIFGIIAGVGTTGATGIAGLQFGDSGAINRGIVYYYNAEDRLYLGTSGSLTTGLSISSGGNVGIGTETPSEKLEINGNTKTTKLITNSIQSSTGENITFFNSTGTGYANLNAKSFNVFSPSDKSYSQDYLSNVAKPTKILDTDGKLERSYMFENEKKDNTPVEDFNKPIISIEIIENCEDVEDKPAEMIEEELIKEPTYKRVCNNITQEVITGYEIKLQNATDIGAMSFNNRLLISEIKDVLVNLLNRLTGAEAKITNLESQVESLNIRLSKLEGVKA